MRRQISLVAALALASSIAVASYTTNKKIPVVNTEWKLVGNPGDGYYHLGASTSSSSNQYDPQTFTTPITLVETNNDDTLDAGLYPTYSSIQGAEVRIYGRPGQFETQLDAQYGAADYDLNISFELIPGTVGATPYTMYIDANESNPTAPYIGKIDFTSQYIGQPFNLQWGGGGQTITAGVDDYNASYTFEPNSHIYLTSRADAVSGGSSSGSYSQYSTNRLWMDIDPGFPISLNDGNGSTMTEINSSTFSLGNVNIDINLTIMSFRNGRWSIFDMNTTSSGTDMNVRLNDDIFTGYSEVDFNNTKKAAAYWYKIDDNSSANDNNISILINDSTITASDLETTMFDDTTNLGDSAWNLVAFPEGKIVNSQTGLRVDNTNIDGTADITIGGLYGETITIPLSGHIQATYGYGFIPRGTLAEANISTINYVLKLADANGSFNTKIVAFPAVETGNSDAGADMLLLSDSDFNVSVTSYSIAGQSLAASERTPYGEQALAFQFNKDLIDGNQKALNLVLSMPSISKDIDINYTSTDATNFTAQASLDDIANIIGAQIANNSGGLLDANDVNVTLFDANFDGYYDDCLIAFKAPTQRSTLSSDAFARFSIYESTYVKTYFNDLNTTYDDGNLTVAYIAGVDRNVTNYGDTADINITTKGIVKANAVHGTSIDGWTVNWDVNNSNDGNFTTIISNSPYVDLVEVNNTTDFLVDLAFNSSFDAGVDRSYCLYVDTNNTVQACTDSNITAGFVSYVWTLDQLVDRFIDINNSGVLADGDIYASGNVATKNLTLLPVWSASPLPVDSKSIFRLLQSMTTSHRIEEIWSYKADGYKLWYSTDLSVAPSEWLGKGSNLFTSRVGDGFWLKSKIGESFTMTAGSFQGETNIKTITHFDNENDLTYNYIFRENILEAPTSDYINSFSSEDGNITDNLPFVITLKRNNSNEGGIYIPLGGGGYQFDINPYTFKHASDQVSLSANADTILIFSDGMAQTSASNTVSIDSYTRPTTPTVSIDSSYIITTSNFEPSTTETVVGNKYTLGFEDAINEANLSTNNLTSAMMTNISTNGKIQPIDISEPTTPKMYTYKFVTRQNINQEGNTSHFLYSDIASIRFVPIFGARYDSGVTSLSTLSDFNQTIKMTYRAPDGNGSNVIDEGGEVLYHLGSIITYLSTDGTAATRADKFDQNGTIINDTTRSFNGLAGSPTTDYDTNGLTLEGVNITTGGVSLAYRPMKEVGAAIGFESQFVVDGTAANGYTDGIMIAKAATTPEYDGSRFYLYYENDTNASVYYGTFDYQDGNNTVYVPLTRIVGTTNEGDTATIVTDVTKVPCFATRTKSSLCN